MISSSVLNLIALLLMMIGVTKMLADDREADVTLPRFKIFECFLGTVMDLVAGARFISFTYNFFVADASDSNLVDKK